MTAELLVNVTPSETRVAYITGGILQEIHIEREAKRGIVGNIYKGRVSRVLPGMQAAFIDIGLIKQPFCMPRILFRIQNVFPGMKKRNSAPAISGNWSIRGRILLCRWSKIRWAPKVRV